MPFCDQGSGGLKKLVPVWGRGAGVKGKGTVSPRPSGVSFQLWQLPTSRLPQLFQDCHQQVMCLSTTQAVALLLLLLPLPLIRLLPLLGGPAGWPCLALWA